MLALLEAGADFSDESEISISPFAAVINAAPPAAERKVIMFIPLTLFLIDAKPPTRPPFTTSG